MTALRDAIEKYINLRQSLGFKLEAAASGLRKFATFMELKSAPYITTDLAYEWATQPAHVRPVWWA
jgi:integrase/recombinase XerD